MDIKKTIMSDQINKWVFSNKGKDIYLVGGYIRDLLLNRESKDRDYIVKGNAREIAKKTSVKFKGTFIELYKNQTFRVALKNGTFIDFSNIYNNLSADLSKRDFTINAIAWSPEKGLIAPSTFLNDLSSCLIRVIKQANLKDDPLRILRAYRFSAQLGYEIEGNTRYYLKQNSSKLPDVSKERITEEFIKILNNNLSHLCLHDSLKDNVLSKIISSNHMHLLLNLNDLEKYNNLINKLDKLNRHDIFPVKLKSYLESSYSMGLTRSGLIRLSILMRDKINNNNVKIPINNMLFSRKIRKGIKALLNTHNNAKLKLNKKRFFQILRHAEGYEYESTVILSMQKYRNLLKLLIMTDQFVLIQNKRLIDGNDVKQIFGISYGKRIRETLDRINELRFMNIIKNRADARRWIISNLT